MNDYNEMSEEALEQMWDEEQKIEDKAEADSIEKSEDPELEWESREEERQIEADEDKYEEEQIEKAINGVPYE
jgi:hypothetical protein